MKYPWYFQTKLNWLALLLLPFSLITLAVSELKRLFYSVGLLRAHRTKVPVIVVGNITVGGTGKTPMVIWLVEYLRQRGLHPGVVSRGYGGRAAAYPLLVNKDTQVEQCGDEALLLAQRLACPIVVDPDRVRAVSTLATQGKVDVIVSDDGLQHLRMHRIFNILMIDGERRFGNGWLLPAGPLRELAYHQRDMELCVVNGASNANEFSLKVTNVLVESLNSDLHDPCVLSDFSGKVVHALAGIGNPERFFQMLESNDITVIRHSFADHHRFSKEDFCFTMEPAAPILMTEKDAVKCRGLLLENAWQVKVSMAPDKQFVQKLDSLLQKFVT